MRLFRHSPMGLPRYGPMGPPAFGPLVGWIRAEQYGRVRVPQIERYLFRAYAHAPFASLHAAADRVSGRPVGDGAVHRRGADFPVERACRDATGKLPAMASRSAPGRAPAPRAKPCCPTACQVTAVATVTGGSWRATATAGPLGQHLVPDHGGPGVSRQQEIRGQLRLRRHRPVQQGDPSHALFEMRWHRSARSPSTTSTREGVLPKGAKVVAVALVAGKSWSKTCAGTYHEGHPLAQDQRRQR